MNTHSTFTLQLPDVYGTLILSTSFSTYNTVTGGLTPDNVAEAAVTLGVMGVDVSSGVEQKGQPGVKDLAVMKSFIENARK